MKPSSTQRIDLVRAALQANDLTSMMITNAANIGWLTGFSGSSAVVIITSKEAVFITDSRYWTQAEAQCPDFTHDHLGTAGGPEMLVEKIVKWGGTKVGFEAAHVSVKLRDKYVELVGGHQSLVATEDIVENGRLIKDKQEIALIEEACKLADEAWSHIIPFVQPGACERDLMLELEWHMRKVQRGEVAFGTIVASGPRSALPHGTADERILQHGDFVIFDFGIQKNGYNSDMTRTVVIGEPTELQKSIYGVVLDALNFSTAAIKPGIAGKAVDAIARDIIGNAGYGDYFGHGLGHSLGRTVHDGHGLSKSSPITLAEGMVLTVEPGIYIPEWGGVRIENDVVVTSTGCRTLSHSSTALLSLG